MWKVFSRNHETAMQLPKKYQDILSKEWLSIFHAYGDLFRVAQRTWDYQVRREQRAAKYQAEQSALEAQRVLTAVDSFAANEAAPELITK